MRIEVEAADDRCVLHLKGRFTTGSNSDYLRTRDVLNAHSFRHVVADLRDVPYLDSTGLAFLVGLYNDAQASRSNFAVSNATRRSREVLELTGLDEVIPVVEDQAAVAAAK